MHARRRFSFALAWEKVEIVERSPAFKEANRLHGESKQPTGAEKGRIEGETGGERHHEGERSDQDATSSAMKRRSPACTKRRGIEYRWSMRA
jgi:hypothetical protein